ncbi:MAG: hypothetical protein AB3N17_17290, partial [Tateyamaria sp.]
MRNRLFSALFSVVLVCAVPGSADTSVSEHGGDTFIASGAVSHTLDASGDAFAAGRSTTVLGQVDGDFHAAGFDVVVDLDVGQDAYAAGATVTVKGMVAEDLTAAGFTVRTERGSRVAGNARLAAATVVIDGPVDGALSATGRDVLLNAPIAGDARIVAQSLRFGPDAVVAGRLTYATETPLDVPARVAPPGRVTFEPLAAEGLRRAWEGVGDMSVFPTFASVFFGFVINLLFYVLLGAIALGFAPRKVSWLRKSIAGAPGRTALQGVVGLSILLGSIPVM